MRRERFEVGRLTDPLAEDLRPLVEEFTCGNDHIDAFFPKGCFTSMSYRLGLPLVAIRLEGDEATHIAGYVNIGFSHVTLTQSEKEDFSQAVPFAQIGAIRVGMIGTHVDCQHKGVGTKLLKAVTGIGRAVSRELPVRFLTADVNENAVGFYQSNLWVPNAHDQELNRGRKASVSMRFDLGTP